MTSDDQANFSLPMYYAFYYKPLFQSNYRGDTKPEMFSPSKMQHWIRKLNDLTDGDAGTSPDALAALDLARNGDQLVWTLVSIVAACLSSTMSDEMVNTCNDYGFQHSV